MDHTPVVIDKIKGDYIRTAGVTTPDDHLVDSRNISFTDKGAKTRDGLVLNNAIPVYRKFIYQIDGSLVADRWIILSTGGNFYDSGVSLVSPILTLVGVTDFSMVVMYGRAYFSPLSVGSPTSGAGDVYVYDASVAATARIACGTAPGSSVTAATSATAGNVESGVHLISVAYVTNSGFVTKTATVTAYTAPGAFKIDLSAIPTGPAGTSQRIIVATKRIVNYTGRAQDYELFFVPSGTIADNVTTVLTINFYDADLIDSADYLIDQLEALPGALGLCNYEGCLVLWRGQAVGVKQIDSTLYISRFGEPESISAIDGLLVVDPGDNGQVWACVSIRKILYALKEDRTYAIQGDLSDSVDALLPIRWPVTLIDNGTGTLSVNGVCKVLDNPGSNWDYAMVLTKTGLSLFNGSYEAAPISWKVEDVWNGINWALYGGNQIYCDPINKLVYVLYGIVGETEPSKVLVFDYKDGLDAENVRITRWSFPFNPTCMGINLSSTTRYPTVNLGRAGTNAGWYKQVAGTLSDAPATTAINSYITLPYFRESEGGLRHYNMIRGLFLGAGTLAITLINFVSQSSLTGLALSVAPSGEQQRMFNFVGEGLSIKLGTNAAGSWFNILTPLKVFVKHMWASRNG